MSKLIDGNTKLHYVSAENDLGQITQNEHLSTAKDMLQVKPEGNNTTFDRPNLVISHVPNTPILVPNGFFPIERKSSNISPFLFLPPSVSPITPMTQMFFPPDFDISQYQMTQHMSSSDMCVSPLFRSPCL